MLDAHPSAYLAHAESRVDMLQKLRSRHPVDVPAEKWGRRRPTLAILGTIAVLFVLLPIVISFLGGGSVAPLPVAAGIGILLVVLVIAGARGKPGHDR